MGQKAMAVGCLDAIADLPTVHAVRFLQQREQYTPCFGAEIPLIPAPEDAPLPAGLERHQLCGVYECYWKPPCDSHRIVLSGSEEAEFQMNNVELSAGTEPVQEPVRSNGAAAAESRTDDQDAVAGIVNRLAESAAVFVSALQELARQSASWSGFLRQQLDGLQRRFETDVASLRETDARHAAEADRTAARVEELASTVGGLSSKVGAIVDRLDRQGEVLQSLCETQARRAAALDQLFETLSRLKTPPALSFEKL